MLDRGDSTSPICLSNTLCAKPANGVALLAPVLDQLSHPYDVTVRIGVETPWKTLWLMPLFGGRLQWRAIAHPFVRGLTHTGAARPIPAYSTLQTYGNDAHILREV